MFALSLYWIEDIFPAVVLGMGHDFAHARQVLYHCVTPQLWDSVNRDFQIFAT